MSDMSMSQARGLVREVIAHVKTASRAAVQEAEELRQAKQKLDALVAAGYSTVANVNAQFACNEAFQAAQAHRSHTVSLLMMLESIDG